ncbi:CDP-glucose 4,6-dehydratase [Methylocella silvestris]|uniref:CDP-glucose 4,6-dehydratase n=1 Tax=Methylocella silvestris TaxID=199596 RepID=UPI001FE056AC|nr:CDP-glucose 4,6-dehydratase [Methylocella silvestris]
MVIPSSSFWAGKRVLLTGHTGFKGSWASLWLRKLGADVFGLALEPDTQPALWNLLGRPFLDGSLGDIRNSAVVNALFDARQPEIVIHMAAQALVHPSYADPVTTFSTNIMGLIHVLEAARRTPSVRAFVNVTSDKCYENREQIWAYREDEPMGGSDPYSASKGCAELVTASYRRSFFNLPQGPRLASGRAGNVIGGGDWSEDRLVADCVRAFQTGSLVLLRNPLATRPWQFVLEPISGYLALAQALYERGSEVAEGWNFAPPDEDAWTVGRVVERLIDAWGSGASWAPDKDMRAKEAMLLRVDATKARLRLGWRPRLPLTEALGWTVDWHKAVAAGEPALDVTIRQIECFEKLLPA